MSKYDSMKRISSKRISKSYLADAQKKFVKGTIFLLGAVLLIIFIFGDHGLLQLHKLKKERAKIQLYISQLRENRKILMVEKDRLENDLKYIEKIAREKYRMAKPGEKVFKVMPKEENN